MNSVVIGLTLLTISVRIGGARGDCVHVKNDDMVEYSCVGGHPADLNRIPSRAEKIRIRDMRIPRITADTFLRFGPTLWVLSCSRCDIADIEPNAFRALINLQQLSLDNNRLTTVKASWFEGFEYLTYLDLNYNRITRIEDGAFEKLASLVDLRLSGNRFECLNLRAMERLRHLKRMFISENPELKCPNAISKFLADREVSFERDPEWEDVDRVSVTESRTSSVPSTTEERRSYTFLTFSTTPTYVPLPDTAVPKNEDGRTSPSLDSEHRYPYPTEIPSPRPSWYPTTRPWTSLAEEEENGEYYKRIGYSDETTPTTPLAASPTDRGGSSPLLDPRDLTPSTRSPKIYSTSEGTFPESKSSYVFESLPPPSESLPPVLKNDQKPDDTTISQPPFETTTDVPLPECPRNSSPRRGTLSLNKTIVFVFLIFLANLVV